MENLSLAELRTILETEKPQLLEALPPAHFAAGHLPGAIALPLDQLQVVAARELTDKTRAFVVYCASATCQNSHLAAAKLESLGYRSVRVFPGGKAAWKDAGLPLEVSR